MNISDQLLCLFNAEIKERDGSYVLEVPAKELSIGDLQEDGIYRVGGLQPAFTRKETDHESEQKSESEQRRGHPEPPVEQGEFRKVEITDVGDQGDGITRVERGFVVIVPDADIGDQVTVEITRVRENYAIGEAIEGLENGN